jgi:glycine cleavage system aminomethyltransferase T
MYDTTEVRIELLTAAVTITAPGEIAQHQRAFESLATMAVHGPAARGLIARAIDSLGA